MLKIILAICILFFNQTTTVFSTTPNKNESVCKSVIARLLSSHIQAELDMYYKKILVYPPIYAPFYGTEVTCADVSTNKTSYAVTVLVRPFVDAHVSVGVDEIQFLVSVNGEVTTVSYKHVEDHKLPPHLQDR
jgi:hypothetical protein